MSIALKRWRCVRSRWTSPRYPPRYRSYFSHIFGGSYAAVITPPVDADAGDDVSVVLLEQGGLTRETVNFHGGDF